VPIPKHVRITTEPTADVRTVSVRGRSCRTYSSNSSQLSLGNQTSAGRSELLNCTVAVTIRDVRRAFFLDGKDARTKREAAIVILDFEFGSQKRTSWNPLNRIGVVKIQISVYEDELSDDGDDQGGQDESKELRIAARYPRSAKNSASEKTVKKAVEISLDPSSVGVSIGGLSISRETEGRVLHTAKLSSYTNGEMSLT
jgi:hypothetical protein